MCPRCLGQSRLTVTAPASQMHRVHHHPPKCPGLGHELHGHSTYKALALIPVLQIFTMSRELAVTLFHRRGARWALEFAVFPSALSGLGSPLLPGSLPGVTAQLGWELGHLQQGRITPQAPCSCGYGKQSLAGSVSDGCGAESYCYPQLAG